MATKDGFTLRDGLITLLESVRSSGGRHIHQRTLTTLSRRGFISAPLGYWKLTPIGEFVLPLLVDEQRRAIRGAAAAHAATIDKLRREVSGLRQTLGLCPDCGAGINHSGQLAHTPDCPRQLDDLPF